MKTAALALAGAAALALASRKATADTGDDSLEAMATRVAQANGAPTTTFLAIIDTENPDWDPSAVNMGPGDSARGGAYSLPQITLTTARDVDDAHPSAWASIDPTRSGDSLMAHPEIACELAAKLVAQLEERVTAHGGSPSDLASLYNSGKFYADAPSSTRNDYVPRFLRNLSARQGVS